MPLKTNVPFRNTLSMIVALYTCVSLKNVFVMFELSTYELYVVRLVTFELVTFEFIIVEFVMVEPVKFEEVGGSSVESMMVQSVPTKPFTRLFFTVQSVRLESSTVESLITPPTMVALVMFESNDVKFVRVLFVTKPFVNVDPSNPVTFSTVWL